MTFQTAIPSPLGTIVLTAGHDGLTGIHFQDSVLAENACLEPTSSNPFLEEAARQITAYFEGKLTNFTLVAAPLGTAFQREVWELLPSIPYGMTVSYGEIARRLGLPKAARAVGGAVGRNPLPIIIPCHRVIGTDGAITGYSSGIQRKEFLLGLEARHREKPTGQAA
jgi:methylated-DNA-[protein]-cysteine S-methyltransferase